MNGEEYWNIKMMQYVTRFATFRKMFTQQTGVHDESIIQEHWELFTEDFCSCAECANEDEDCTIHFNVPPYRNHEADDEDDEDDDTPSWVQ